MNIIFIILLIYIILKFYNSYKDNYRNRNYYHQRDFDKKLDTPIDYYYYQNYPSYDTNDYNYHNQQRNHQLNNKIKDESKKYGYNYLQNQLKEQFLDDNKDLTQSDDYYDQNDPTNVVQTTNREDQPDEAIQQTTVSQNLENSTNKTKSNELQILDENEQSNETTSQQMSTFQALEDDDYYQFDNSSQYFIENKNTNNLKINPNNEETEPSCEEKKASTQGLSAKVKLTKNFEKEYKINHQKRKSKENFFKFDSVNDDLLQPNLGQLIIDYFGHRKNQDQDKSLPVANSDQSSIETDSEKIENSKIITYLLDYHKSKNNLNFQLSL